MKLNHWSKDMKEVCLVTTQDGVYNFRIAGGSDKGEFPIISDVLPPDTRGVEYKGGGELVTQVGYNNHISNINNNNIIIIIIVIKIVILIMILIIIILVILIIYKILG